MNKRLNFVQVSIDCTNCGYLGNGDIAAEPLEEDDKLLIIPNYCEDHET